MSSTPKITLIGLYNYYDGGLFDLLTLPDILDKQTAVNSILLAYGEAPLIYTNGDFLRQAIGIWSAKYAGTIEKIATALEAEYNPIHNYDRYEKYSDKEKLVQTGTAEDKVSAYNATDYQPDSKTETGGNTEREFDHDAHLYGNIGVTTSQEMLKAEIDLRVNENVYDVVADLFYREFCLYSY